MAGLSAARALSPPADREPSRFALGLATGADEPEIRRLLREYPLAGDIVLGFEREPDSRLAATVEGDVHQTIVARERGTGRLAAIASRSVQHAFVNGAPARLAYLGQLRIATGFGRSRRLLDEGFAFCRTLQDAHAADACLASVVADNAAAHRLLAGRCIPGRPRFAPAGRLQTLVLRVGGRVRADAPAGVRLARGTPALADGIAACLRRHGRRRQFARVWTAADLRDPERTRGLALEDFVVALHGERVVGCVASWDQRPFKQAIVRGYAPPLGRWRPLLNAIAPLTRAPYLPPVGRRLEFAYLSHLAADDDRADVVVALVAAACAAQRPGIDYLVTGIAAAHPACAALVHRFRPRVYHSDLYLVAWPDTPGRIAALDARAPHPEVATL